MLIILALTIIGIFFLHGLLYYFLRNSFRKLEKDLALVTLNVSTYPVLIILILISLKIAISYSDLNISWLNSVAIAAIILAIGYWLWQLLVRVIFYYLKKMADKSEIMWDNVLFPLLEAIAPLLIVLICLALILQLSFGIDLSGIWVAFGGASFIIGFATKDILANFFSGIVLLIDTPFQFGDVLQLENGTIGILQKIGLRVTQIYQFKTHTEAYIPNSILQAQRIINLSRPIAPIHYSVSITFLANCNLEHCQKIMEEVIVAHPDTVGNIDTKLEYLDRYFNSKGNCEHSLVQKQRERDRLIAEQEVNFKLEEIEQNLEALVLTLQFLEQDGLDADEIITVQDEYQNILYLVGLESIEVEKLTRKQLFTPRNRYQSIQIEETNSTESLIYLIREWYRLKLQDIHIVDEDRKILSEIWEYQIQLLKKRLRRLLQQISNPERIETRLDDYVNELLYWLKTKFKQARNRCHDPDVRLEPNINGSSAIFIKFSLNYYIDDVRLEDGERGERVSSEIYREILQHLQCYMVNNS